MVIAITRAVAAAATLLAVRRAPISMPDLNMSASHERRLTSERRNLLDRRGEAERHERPSVDRRRISERRAGIERRLSILSAGDQIHAALRLLTRVVEMGAVTEQELRTLESAMLRLRFALDRLEE
jgi:hypothetical protein